MKTTESPTITTASYEDLVREMIVRLGEDPSREGLIRTPERVHKAYDFLTKGYREDPEALLKGALFTVTYDEMVIVKDIEMFSLCEHHMLPFFGKVHVAYIPNGKVIGLSKIPRLIELFSRRLQIQERLTTQIAETIQKVIEPQGVGVVIEARHLCMMGAPLVTFLTNSASVTRVVRVERGGIAPSSISEGLGLGPTALWQTWQVDFTMCSPTR